MTDKKHAQADPQTPELISIAKKVEHLIPPEVQTYKTMKQDPTTNAIVHKLHSGIPGSKSFAPQTLLDSGKEGRTTIITSRDETTNIMISGFLSGGKGITETTHRLLDYITMTWTNSSQSKECRFSLQDYFNFFGISRSGTAHQQVKYDLEVLTSSIKHTPNPKDLQIITLFQDAELRGGNVVITWSDKVFNYLKKLPVSPMNINTWRLYSRRNPHSPYFARKLQLHKNMNYGKPNEGRISVKALIEAAPKLPRREEVSHITQRIINPFERDMDALSCLGIEWHYCRAGGEPLKEGERESLNYNEWEALLVEFTMADYPDEVQEQKLERKREAITKNEERKEKAKLAAMEKHLLKGLEKAETKQA